MMTAHTPNAQKSRIAFNPDLTCASLFLALSLGGMNGTAMGANMKIIKKEDIKLPYTIESRPVVLRGPKSGDLSLAVVAGERVGDHDFYTSVDAYRLDGKHLRGLIHGFPALRLKAPFKIAPADQITAVDYNNDGVDEILAMDTSGAPRYLRLDGSEIKTNTKAQPDHGVLAWPPTPLAISGKPGLMLLSLQDGGMMSDSKARLGLVNAAGQQYPGFPVSFFGSPERNEPIVLAQEDRVFVWLGLGTVDGFAISSGKRLPGFPTATIGESVPSGDRHMVYSAAAKRIFVSTASNSLASVDPMTGKIDSIAVPGAQTLTGLVSTETNLYTYDEGTGTLFTLDAKGKLITKLKLDITEGAKLASLHAQSAQGETGVFLVTYTEDGKSKSKIDALYDQYAPAEYKKKVQTAVSQAVSEEFDHVDKTNSEQIKYARQYTQELKEGFLENQGIDFIRIAKVQGSSQVVAVNETQGKMQVVLNDVVPDVKPDGNFEGYYPKHVFSTLYADAASNSHYLLVPLNNEKKNTAVIKIYQIQH